MPDKKSASSHTPATATVILGEETSPATTKTRRFFQFLVSPPGICCLVGVATFLIASLILSWEQLTVNNLVQEGVSTQNVNAPHAFQIVNEEETSHLKEMARQSVPPIYKAKGPINRSMHENLAHLLRDIEKLETNTVLSQTERKRSFHQMFGESDNAETIFDYLFVNGGRLTSSERWEHIRMVSQVTLERLTAKDLTLSDYIEHREELIDQTMPQIDLTPNEREAIHLLVGRVLKPNRIKDDDAIFRAQSKAEAAVRPEIRAYRKGDRIVEKGEKVSSLQIQALKHIGKPVDGINWMVVSGIGLLTAFFGGFMWMFLYVFERRRFFTLPYIMLISTLTLGILTLFKLFRVNGWPIIAFPLAAYSLTLTIFTHSRIAIMATVLMAFLIAMTLKIDLYPMSVLLFGSICGIFVLSRRQMTGERRQLMLAGLVVGVTNAILLITVYLLSATVTDDPIPSLTKAIAYGLLGSGILSGILTFGALPYLESLFKLVTPFTLLELANHDQPLLKRMQFEAPGTFHHSLMVATLSEAAAEAIGANALLTRVGSLYHDIGKMKRPLFFIENQAYFGAENPHDKLTPRLSKMVITAHPRDSLEMARQHKLPEVLMKFMTEHHGTLVAGYFYNKACLEEGAENVNKSQFRYPGPKPNIKETAIVMLADACESAVRALKNPTVAQVEERIEKLIWQRVDDGQFDHCPLTFKDLTQIKDTFVRVLRGIQHNRIEYQVNIVKELKRKAPVAPVPPTQQNSGSQGA